MSKHGRMICSNCRGEHPVSRENLKRRARFGGKFLCKRCERGRGKSSGRPSLYNKEAVRR